MEIKQCFEASCRSEVEYSCDCSSPETYSCKLHLAEHLESSSNAHHFKPLFWKPCKETKEMLLRFLTKEKSKQDELRKKFVDSFVQNLQNLKNNLEEHLDELDSNLFEINSSFEKVFQAQKISKSEQDPILKLLTLHPDDAIEKAKKIIPISSNFLETDQTASIKSKKIKNGRLCKHKLTLFSV
ncbi:unnamed protein product [Blepharisma stoltei]|uniref:Uncharacterized protein n=1 Tax=Blepharisma stoltei TaxID=1481888 RepID=A0AAU9JXQ9_9CILI|nr:unnamed protein product [Blepharisma stoltei]